MRWAILWSGDAVGELLDISSSDRRQANRIYQAVELPGRSEQGDVRKLVGRPDEWRLRVGDWRVIFVYDRAEHTMTVLSVRRRNEGTYRD